MRERDGICLWFLPLRGWWEIKRRGRVGRIDPKYEVLYL